MHKSCSRHATHVPIKRKQLKKLKKTTTQNRTISTSISTNICNNKSSTHKVSKRYLSQTIEYNVKDIFENYQSEKNTFNIQHYRDYILDIIKTQNNISFSPLECSILRDESISFMQFHTYIDVKIVSHLKKLQQKRQIGNTNTITATVTTTTNNNNNNNNEISNEMTQEEEIKHFEDYRRQIAKIPVIPWSLPLKAIPSLDENVIMDASTLFDRITSHSSLIDELTSSSNSLSLSV